MCFEFKHTVLADRECETSVPITVSIRFTWLLTLMVPASEIRSMNGSDTGALSGSHSMMLSHFRMFTAFTKSVFPEILGVIKWPLMHFLRSLQMAAVPVDME